MIDQERHERWLRSLKVDHLQDLYAKSCFACFQTGLTHDFSETHVMLAVNPDREWIGLAMSADEAKTLAARLLELAEMASQQ